MSEAWKKFGDRELTVKIMLSRATFLVSKGDWISRAMYHQLSNMKAHQEVKKALPPKTEAVVMKTHYGHKTSITPHSAENYVINF